MEVVISALWTLVGASLITAAIAIIVGMVQTYRNGE